MESESASWVDAIRYFVPAVEVIVTFLSTEKNGPFVVDWEIMKCAI